MRSVTAPETGSAFSIASSSVSTPAPVAADSATAERRPASVAPACASSSRSILFRASTVGRSATPSSRRRSEEHTSELQSPCNLVCRLLLEKKKNHNKLLIYPYI